MTSASAETVDIPRLEAIREEAAEIVREFSRSQAEEWRKIPALALEADGRTGHSDQYSRAYRSGLWALRSGVRDGWYELFVDCATGDLVNAGENLDPAPDHAVLRVLQRPEELDAQAIVERLEAEARKEHGSYYDADEKIAWREKTREETGVTSPYVRTESPPPIDWSGLG